MSLKSFLKMPVVTDKEIESGDIITAPRSFQPRFTMGSDPVQGCTRTKEDDETEETGSSFYTRTRTG